MTTMTLENSKGYIDAVIAAGLDCANPRIFADAWAVIKDYLAAEAKAVPDSFRVSYGNHHTFCKWDEKAFGSMSNLCPVKLYAHPQPVAQDAVSVSDKDADRFIDLFDDACINNEGRRVSWYGYTRNDRNAVAKKALESFARGKAAQPSVPVEALIDVESCDNKPSPELWNAYQRFNEVYQGMNTQQALRAAINSVLEGRRQLIAEHDSKAAQPETPNKELHLHMQIQEWRSALVGLCQGREVNVSTPEKAAAHIRARLRSMKTAQPSVPADYEPTNDEVHAWRDRNDMDMFSLANCRTAIDDARSMHLIAEHDSKEGA